MKNPYLEKVESFINNKSAKKQILAELQYHIEDKTEYYADIGYSREEAEGKAIEEMGEPEQAAVSLNALHSVKWYKNIFNIITLAALTVIFIFSCIFGYVFSYGNELNDISHSVVKDIVSLAIFSVLALILILSYRHKNKFTALSVIVFCVAVLLLPLVWLAVYDSGLFDELIMRDIDLYFINYFKSLPAVFEPLYFPLVTLFTKGPVGLADTVLTPTVYNYTVRSIYSVLAYFTVFFFIVWGFAAVFKIRQSERCKSDKALNKTNKVFAVFSKCLCLIVAAVLAVSAVPAVFRAPKTLDKRHEMIDFVTRFTEYEADNIIDSAKSYGIELENTSNIDGQDFGYEVYTYNSGNCSINYIPSMYDDVDDYTGNCFITYYVNLDALPSLASKEDIEVDSMAFDNLEIEKTTLDQFRNDVDYYKAQNVTAYTEGKIQFQYIIKNSDKRYVIEFENGVLSQNEKMSFDGEDFEDSVESDTEPETTIPVPSSTAFNPLQ